jgi:hypothetical protein
MVLFADVVHPPIVKLFSISPLSLPGSLCLIQLVSKAVQVYHECHGLIAVCHYQSLYQGPVTLAAWCWPEISAAAALVCAALCHTDHSAAVQPEH